MGNSASTAAPHAPTQEWSSSMFSCCSGFTPDLPCGTAWCAPCTVYAKVHDGLAAQPDYKTSKPMGAGSKYGCCVCPCIAFRDMYDQRRAIRKMYNLPDDGCLNDTFIVTHCCCCALCQQDKQLQEPRPSLGMKHEMASPMGGLTPPPPAEKMTA